MQVNFLSSNFTESMCLITSCFKYYIILVTDRFDFRNQKNDIKFEVSPTNAKLDQLLFMNSCKNKGRNERKGSKPNQDIGWCGSSGHSWPPKIEWCDHSWQWQVSLLVDSSYKTTLLVILLLSIRIYLSNGKVNT